MLVGSSLVTSRMLSRRLFDAFASGVRPGVNGWYARRPEGRAPVSAPNATWFDIDQNPVV